MFNTLEMFLFHQNWEIPSRLIKKKITKKAMKENQIDVQGDHKCWNIFRTYKGGTNIWTFSHVWENSGVCNSLHEGSRIVERDTHNELRLRERPRCNKALRFMGVSLQTLFSRWRENRFTLSFKFDSEYIHRYLLRK